MLLTDVCGAREVAERNRLDKKNTRCVQQRRVRYEYRRGEHVRISHFERKKERLSD